MYDNVYIYYFLGEILMAENKNDIKKLLSQIKYGDLFRVGDFSSGDEARRFIDEYVARMPQHSDDELKVKQDEIAKASEQANFKEAEYQRKEDLSSAVGMLDDYCGRYIPGLLHGVDGYECDIEQNGDALRTGVMPPKRVADVCYGYVQECLRAGLESKKGHAPELTVAKVKTPYEKLPLTTRIKYRADKLFRRQPDAQVDLLAQCNNACRTIRGHFSDSAMHGGVFFSSQNHVSSSHLKRAEHSDSPLNTTVNKYLQKLVDMPYEEMIGQLKDDHSPLRTQSHEALVQRNEAMQHLDSLNGALAAMQTDNANAVAVRETMEGKVVAFEKVHQRVGAARDDLAKRGLITNEDRSGKQVHPSVAVNRQADAAANGEQISWTDALARQKKSRD